jgi:hypothetical protein
VTGVGNPGMPSAIYRALQANAEFRLLFADHVHRHFFNGGALTAAAATARYMERVEEIDRAVVPESARWGDTRAPNNPFDRDSNWVPEIEWLRLAYFPQRSAILVDQFRDIGLYPDVVAPSFEPQRGYVTSGSTVTVSAPSGTVYYTLDGSDPRLEGGAVSPAALVYSAPLPITTETTVRSRVLDAGVWSALNEATFRPDVPLRVTELMYHPTDPPSGPYVDDDFEFIELENVGTAPIALGGVKISQGITFTFAAQTLAPGGHVLVVRNEAAFPTRYGAGKPVVGHYSGKLANEGERILIETATGDDILDFVYDDAWYPLSDGGGRSLVIVDATAPREAWSSAEGWRASTFDDGSPGAAELPFCSDGVDNDGDTLVDFGSDAGCSSAQQDQEDPACNDGLDDDGDGSVDLADPNCDSAGDDDEAASPIDAFVCYSASASGPPAFNGADVTLDDEVETGRPFSVRSPKALCVPAVIDKSGALHDAGTYLEGFDIRAVDGNGSPARTGVFFESLGPVYLDTFDAERLLVPAAVDDAPVGPPLDANHAVDRYKCYRATPSDDFPRLFPRGVALGADSVLSTGTYEFKGVSRACTPVAVDGGPVKNTEGRLVCYRVRRARGEAPDEPLAGLYATSGDLGATRLDTKRVEEICVPAH